MTPDELNAIEERAAKATPGPWNTGNQSRLDTYGKYLDYADLLGPKRHSPSGEMLAADSEFCAHAREDVPALVAEVRRLREEWHGLHETASERVRENARLREALTFYASLTPFKPTHPCDIDVRFQIDGGELHHKRLQGWPVERRPRLGSNATPVLEV